MKDILDNKALKAMPYDVPSGYFERLRESLGSKESHQGTRRWPAYMAAAAFALLMAAGSFFLGRVSGPDFTGNDYIVFSEGMTNAITYEDYIYADVLSEDDIIEYLIYTDTELEELY